VSAAEWVEYSKKLVLFRTASGALGCLEDVCPHRGVALSGGKVEDESLACPYRVPVRGRRPLQRAASRSDTAVDPEAGSGPRRLPVAT
jgi:hypothetical protein